MKQHAFSADSAMCWGDPVHRWEEVTAVLKLLIEAGIIDRYQG